MKQLSLLLFIVLIFINLLAQEKDQQLFEKENLRFNGNVELITSDNIKTGEEIIWQEDFTGGFPDGWTIVDSTEYEMPWYWTNDSIFGNYTMAYINSETASTGYMAMNADGYNTIPQFAPPDSGEMIDPPLNVDSYFQLPVQDFSAYPGLLLEFHAQYRYFTGMRYDVEISNDFNPGVPDSANWDSYQVNIDAEVNDFIFDKLYILNISASAAGYDSVYIRFHAYGSSHYFWNVDDIKIKIPYQNNLELSKTWNFYAWHNYPP